MQFHENRGRTIFIVAQAFSHNWLRQFLDAMDKNLCHKFSE